jgi:GcrA cell cycle regulator
MSEADDEKMTRAPWSKERNAYLEHLYVDTRLSNNAMTADFNAKFGTDFTRSAVIGKIDRLGIKKKHPAVRANRNLLNSGGVPNSGGRPRKTVAAVVHSVRDVTPRSAPGPVPRQTAVRDEDASIVPVRLEEPTKMADGSVDIYHLTSGTCRWPLGEVKDRPPYMYCGAKPVTGHRYCAHHARIGIRSQWHEKEGLACS